MAKFCQDCGASLKGSLTGECNPCKLGRGKIALSNPLFSTDSAEWRESFKGRPYTEKELAAKRRASEAMKDMNLINLIRRRKGLTPKKRMN